MLDVPGGNLLYAAAGLRVWLPATSGNLDVAAGNVTATENGVGLLARVGEDYPRAWLRSFEKRGFDTRGIHILAEALDLRYFQATLESQEVQHNNPVAHFARLGLPFPRSLLGYQPPADLEG